MGRVSNRTAAPYDRDSSSTIDIVSSVYSETFGYPHDYSMPLNSPPPLSPHPPPPPSPSPLSNFSNTQASTSSRALKITVYKSIETTTETLPPGKDLSEALFRYPVTTACYSSGSGAHNGSRAALVSTAPALSAVGGGGSGGYGVSEECWDDVYHSGESVIINNTYSHSHLHSHSHHVELELEDQEEEENIMLQRFLTVDSRDDALVVEARVAIKEGRVRNGDVSDKLSEDLPRVRGVKRRRPRRR